MEEQKIEMLREQLQDIYGIWSVPFWRTNGFRISLLIGILTLIGTGALFFIWRWYCKRTLQRMPAWQRALHLFKELYPEKVATLKQAELLYETIADALRIHLQERYSCDLQSCTELEVVAALVHYPFPKKWHKQLQGILDRSVEVRFGGASIDRLQMRRHIDDACALVQATMPEEKPRG